MICSNCARQADDPKRHTFTPAPPVGPAKHRCEAPLTCTCHHRKVKKK